MVGRLSGLKNKTFAIIIGFIVTVVVAFANFFTIIEPAINGNYKSTIAMIAGPVLFVIVALIIYSRGHSKNNK